MTYTDPETVPPVWQVGDVILDRYEVRRIFTDGGMGLVYRVHHRGWGMALAVKSPRPEFLQSGQQIESFEREAETWVNLGLHPHIVSCYYIRCLGGIPRIFAEFVEGGTLSEWIHSRKLYEGGTEQAMKRIMDVAIQFAWGLHFAHEKGLVHQDVKPGNVLMAADGTAKVSDFGLASARRVSADDTTVAARPGQSILVPGSGFMTPPYASPEQLRGEALSRKTDVWSWAVSLLEMLVGEVTWASGLAAPALLEQLDDRQFGDDLIALLESCFGTRTKARLTSFVPVLESLMRCYTSRFGEYGRRPPDAVQLSSDEMNNRAVSLADLGKYDDALLSLEAALSIAPSHVPATYNYAQINRRCGYKSDAFGRDALDGLVENDPTDSLALVASGLFCMERGLAFRANELLSRLRKLPAQEPPYTADFETMLRNAAADELSAPDILKLCDGVITSLRVSPDARSLIITTADGMSVHRAETGECGAKIGPGYEVRCFSGSGVLLQKESQLLAWNLKDEPTLVASFRAEIPDDECFAISNSGCRCVTMDYDVLRMHDAQSGETIWEEEIDYMEENGPSVRALAFSADERFVVFGRGDRLENLQVRTTEDGSVVKMGKCAVDSCRDLFPLGNRFMLSVSWDHLLQLWDFEKNAALGSRQLHASAQFGVSEIEALLIATLHPDDWIQFLKVPSLSPLATVGWRELCHYSQPSCGRPKCLASADGRTWHVGTSDGEVLRFRLSEPRRSPALIAKPVTREQLTARRQRQAELLSDARQFLGAGSYLDAIQRCREARLIRSEQAGEAEELHDQIVGFGRKVKPTGVRLRFDLERTILGGEFEIVSVDRDCRYALAKRVHFQFEKDYNGGYVGDFARLIHLRSGRIESLPAVPSEHHSFEPRRYAMRLGAESGGTHFLTPDGEAVVVNSASGLSLYPLKAGSRPQISDARGNVQFALNGVAIVSVVPGRGFIADVWHVLPLKGGVATQVQAKTPILRVLPDGFHACAIESECFHRLEWPFQSALDSLRLPVGIERRQLTSDMIACTSDCRHVFVADEVGALHFKDLKTGYWGAWRRVDAHAAKVTNIFAGADPRFICTVAPDGLRIWTTDAMKVVFQRSDIVPAWVSDDFRFAVERNGNAWEIEWDFDFEIPADAEKRARPHIETFLKTRRAAAQFLVETRLWGQTELEVLARELSKCGCGVLAATRLDSLVNSQFSHLL